MSEKRENQKIEKLTKGLIGLLAYNILLPYNVTSYGAGVVVDPSALEEHRATIGKTANGIDQIDIVAPNSNGLSHNKFQEFNVGENGMILNNSAEMTLTRLAGLVYGNNNLTKGNEAEVILSEVTGIKRSEIEGFIEIAGKETEFILANSNGIYLSNGGFLNMSKTTLTTGSLEENNDGGLGFRINDGIVEVAEGGTINIEDVDYFEILSRAAKIGGVLSSSRTENRSTKELKVLTGDNTYNYDTGEYTSEDSQGKYDYAIDASELGAVSAGKIKLIATDKGVGVNSQASMIATVGNLDIDSKGDIKVKTAVTRRGDVTMKSSQGNVSQQGEEGLIIAENNLEITAAKDVNFEGEKGYTVGKNKVSITGENVTLKNESIVTAVDREKTRGENIVINARGNIELEEKTALVAGNNLDITGENLDNIGTITGENTNIDIDEISNSGDITGINTLDIKSDKILNSGKMTGKEHLKITGTNQIINSGNILSDKNVEISKFSKIINSGNIASDDQLSISETGVLTNEGVIQAEKVFNIWGELVNNSGRIYSGGRGNLTADFLTNEGLFYADGELTITADRVTNAEGGQIISNSENILIDAANVNNSGQIVSEDETKIINGTRLQNSSEGQIAAQKGNVIIESAVISTEGSISGKGVEIRGGVVNNSGQLVSGENSTDINSTILTNSGLMLSEKNINITSDEIINRSNILAGNYFNDAGELVEGEGTLVFTGEKIENEGKLKAATGMQLTSKNLTNSGTIQNVNNILSIDVQNELLNSNSIYSEGTLDIDSTSSVVNTGDIYSENQLDITTSNLNNQKNIQGNAVNLSGDVLENKNTGVIYSSTDTSINTTNITNEGNIFAKRNLGINSNNLNNKAEAQIASNNIDVNTSEKVYNEGIIIAQNNLNVTTKDIETQSNSVIKGSTAVDITADKIINRGNILTEGMGNINTKVLENTETATLGSTKKEDSEAANVLNINVDESVADTGTVTNAGAIYSAGELNIKGNSLENTGNISSIGNTTAILSTLKNEGFGEIISAADLILNIEEETVNTGNILANRDILLTITNIGLTNSGGIINASRKMSLVTEHVNNNNGQILSGQETKIHTINLENNGGKLISNGSLIIDLTQLGVHAGDYNLTGTVYGDQLIQIKNFNNIINNQIELMSNGDIEITSTEKNINNSKKIVAGKDLTLDAQKGYVVNEGTKGEEALLSSGEDLTLVAKNYINNTDSKLYGGTGTTSINLQEDFENKGKMLALGNIELTVADGKDVTNKRQIQANGSLNITADEILLKESTSLYATDNIDLLARQGHIINEAGAQILTLLGDIKLKAAGNIYNKANTSRGAKIKAGGNVTVEAINLYNEAIKYQDQEGFVSTHDLLNMSDAEIWSLFMTTSAENGNFVYGTHFTGSLKDKYFSQSVEMIIYYSQFFDRSYNGSGSLNPYITSDNKTDDFWITRVSSGWEDFIGKSKFRGNWVTDRAITFRAPSNTLRARQASLESGGDVTINLRNNLENGGVIRADDNINIQAQRVHNDTLENRIEVLDKMNLHFKLEYYTSGKYLTGLHDKRIDKMTKWKNYVAQDKAIISAGQKTTINAAEILNRTTLGNTVAYTDSVKEYTGESVRRNSSENFENQEGITEHKQEDTAAVTEKKDNTAVETPKEVETPASETTEKIKGVDLIIDPKENIDIPDGDSGIFIRNDDLKLKGASNPLIETNIDFINQDNYFGSGYVFEKLSEDPQDYNRRLGDNYYETTLVNEMYLKTTGGRKLEGEDFDEISLMKYLLDNSVLASQELGLTVGQELTNDQMTNLDKDIVWYVTEKVDGVEVLVPKIYVTSNSVRKGEMAIDSNDTGSVISGEYVTVETDKFENIGSTVNGSKLVKIQADSILNKYGEGSKGVIKGGDISLSAVNDIKNIGASIAGSGNVFLKTEKGDIINETTIEREKFFDGYADKIKDTGAISGNNVVLNSARDIKNAGGVVVANEKISATAKGNIELDALKLKSKTERHTRYEVYKEDQEINLGSTFKAGTGVYVAADKDVKVRASNISTKEGDVVITGDSVTVEALKNKKNTYYHRDKTTSWFDTDRETITDNSETLANASIDAGTGNVKIVSNKDINLIGSKITGAGDENLIMSKEGDVNIKTIALERHYKRDLTKRSVLSDSKSEVSETITGARKSVLNQHDDTGSDGSSNAKSGRFSSGGINTSAEGLHGKGYSTGTNLSEYGATGGATVALFNSTEVSERLDAKVHGKTSIEGGSVTIAAKNDVNLESVNIDMKNTAKVIAEEGDVNSTYVKDEVKTSADQKTISVGAGASYNVQILQVGESVKKQVDYSKESEYSEGSAGEVAMRGAEFGGQLTKLTGGSLVDGAVEVGVSVSESHKESDSKDAVDSTIKAKNIVISAKNGKVDFKGMQMEGTESVAIDADSFNLEASKSEYHEKEDGYHTNVTLKGTASVSLKGGPDVGAEIGVAASTVNAHTDSETYNNATIKGKNVSLNVTNDANLKGANITGDNVSVDVGGDLNIESLQDTLDHNLHSTDVNVSVGVSVDATLVPTANGSVGATYGQVYENKKWVKTQSGITGGNVKINVDGNTDLKGATIAADNGNLDFTTGSLTHEDLKDSHVRDGGYGGFSASFSKQGVDSVDVKGGRVEGFHKQQNVNSTIGAGNVVVGGKKLEDTGLGINRDTDKAIVTTQDEKHFKFDLDYTISPGDFKKKKKTKDSDVRKRNLGDDSDNPMRRVDVDGTDVVVRRRPTTSGTNRTPDKVTSRPTVAVENKVNIKVDTSTPTIDTGKRNKIDTINPVIDSGRVTKVEITPPTIDSGKINKIVVKQPNIDTGIIKKIDIDTPTIIPGDKIVDKVNKPVTVDGEKTKVKMDNLKKEIDQTIKVRKEKLGISTPEYDTKLLKSTPKEEAGDPAKVRDYTPKSEPVYEYAAKKGSEVSLGKEMETIIRDGQGKPDGPYVATNKLLSAKIKGQEDFFKKKGYKDSIGDNYGEIQKNQLHKIVKGDGPNNMKALDEGALMKFIQDLDTYDQGLKAAKLAHDAGDTKGADQILKDIKDFANIKADSAAFKKYTKEVKKKEKLKESETAVRNKDKKITPTEKDLKEAEKNGGYFIRKENGKLVKYNVENILKDTKFKDDASGNVVTRDDFKTAEYNKELGGKVRKISEDGDSTKFWVMKDGADKPVIKEVPKYKFEKDTEKFRDPMTDKVFTKAQLKEKGKVALDDSNTRFMVMDKDGKVTIEKEVKFQKAGSEKLLDPKTGDVLRDSSGKEINVTDLEGISKTVQNFGGERINGTVVDLKDGRKVVFREKDAKARPATGDIVGVGGNKFYRTSGAFNVADSSGKYGEGRDVYLAPKEGLADKYKDAEIFTEERSEKTSFVDEKTGLRVTEKDFEGADFNKEFGGKVLETNDPNRKLVLKDGESEPIAVELPKTELVPGSEFYVDSDTGAKVKPEDIKNAPVNKLLGQEAVEISDGRYFTLNEKGEVSVTQIDKITELPGKVVDPKTDSEISDNEFKEKKEFNTDLDQEAVKISDGRYFVQDGDGKFGIREVSEVQERSEAAIDPETGKQITNEGFESSKKPNKDLGEDAVDLGNGRYFVKDGDKIQIKEVIEVQERPETAIDPVTKKEMTSDNFESNKKYNKDLGEKAVDLGDGRYFVKDGDKIEIKELKEVQEKPETAIDPVTKKEMTSDNFESNKKYNKDLGQEAVDLGDGRYFVKDGDKIEIKEVKEVQERPETAIDPVTKQEMTSDNFESNKKYNEDLGQDAVDLGNGRYFTKDENGDIKISTTEKNIESVGHIIDPKTKKEVTREDIERSDFDNELGEKGIKIEDGRYFTLDKDGEITITEVVKHDPNVYLDEKSSREVSADDIKNGEFNDFLGEKAIKIDDSNYFVLNDKGEVEVAEITTESRKDYDIIGEGFEKRITQEEYRALKDNPELNGKVVNLGDDKILVMKADGEGYITSSEKLEKKVATETINSLLKDAISKNDPKRLKEILNQGKDNTRISLEMKADLKGLYTAGNNKKITDKQLIERVNQYMEKPASENYMDDNTGRIFDLNKDKFKKVKENSKDKTKEFKLNSKEKIIVDNETGNVKLRTTETKSALWEGRKDWAVYKVFNKIFGKKKDKDADIDKSNNLHLGDETTLVENDLYNIFDNERERNPTAGRPLPEIPGTTKKDYDETTLVENGLYNRSDKEGSEPFYDVLENPADSEGNSNYSEAAEIKRRENSGEEPVYETIGDTDIYELEKKVKTGEHYSESIGTKTSTAGRPLPEIPGTTKKDYDETTLVENGLYNRSDKEGSEPFYDVLENPADSEGNSNYSEAAEIKRRENSGEEPVYETIGDTDIYELEKKVKTGEHYSESIGTKTSTAGRPLPEIPGTTKKDYDETTLVENGLYNRSDKEGSEPFYDVLENPADSEGNSNYSEAAEIKRRENSGEEPVYETIGDTDIYELEKKVKTGEHYSESIGTKTSTADRPLPEIPGTTKKDYDETTLVENGLYNRSDKEGSEPFYDVLENPADSEGSSNYYEPVTIGAQLDTPPNYMAPPVPGSLKKEGDNQKVKENMNIDEDGYLIPKTRKNTSDSLGEEVKLPIKVETKKGIFERMTSKFRDTFFKPKSKRKPFSDSMSSKDQRFSTEDSPESSVEDKKSPKMEAKIKKVGELENTQKWNDLKTAANVRYVQKIAEDSKLIGDLKKKTEGFDLEGGIDQSLDSAYSKEEGNQLIQELAIKKQEAFNQAAKLKNNPNTTVKVLPLAEIQNEDHPNIEGYYSEGEKTVVLGDKQSLGEKLRVMDHELGHKNQFDLLRNKELAERGDLKKDYDNFDYDNKNYTSNDKEYYAASILERDTRKNERVTKKGLQDITDTILENSIPEDKRGYIAISNPKQLRGNPSEKFLKGDVELGTAAKYLNSLVSEGKELTGNLNKKDRKKLEEITKDYKDLSRLEVGENSKKVMLENLGRDLNDLRVRNKIFSSKLDSVLKTKKDEEVSVEDIMLDVDKDGITQNGERLAPKTSEERKKNSTIENEIESKMNLKIGSVGEQAHSTRYPDLRRGNQSKKNSDLESLIVKYEKSKEGVTGEEGHSYKLNPKKEGKVLAAAEKSYSDAKNRYQEDPTDKNRETFLKKEQKFKSLLKRNESKMDLIASQEKLGFKSALDRRTIKTDKYKGKVKVVKKEEIGLLKPVKKAKKEKIDKDVLKAEYTKGLVKGEFYQGKPDIVDIKMRPENIVKAKDDTVNILIHGTYSALAAENEWSSSKSAQAKAVDEQYGGESVAFKWSGKNTADTRKEAGKELAQIIEGYNRKGIKVNVIAHSHGGNVVNEALKLTDGRVENLVTLGTPVRKDHRVDRETIEKKTGNFLNVMSNEDSVTRMGGFDTKTDVTKYVGGDNAFRRANRKDMNADKVLKVDGASHSELHSLAVIKQLKPLADKTKSPMRGAQVEKIALKDVFKNEYGKDLKDLKTDEKMKILKDLSKKSETQKLDYTEKAIASAVQSELGTSKRYKKIEEKIDKEFSKRVLADKKLSETLADNGNKRPDGADAGIKKSDVDKIIKYRLEAFEKVTGIKPKKEVKVIKVPKGIKADGYFQNAEFIEKKIEKFKELGMSESEIEKLLKDEKILVSSETLKTVYDKMAIQPKQKQEGGLNRTLDRLQTLSHELTHKEQREIIRDKERAEKLGIGEDRKLFKYASELNDNTDSTTYKYDLQERDAFARENNLLDKLVKDLEKKGHTIRTESKVKISKPTLTGTTNTGLIDGKGYIELKKTKN